jgi:hypothetical protein
LNILLLLAAVEVGLATVVVAARAGIEQLLV